MFSDFKILRLITSKNSKPSLPQKSWLNALLQTIEWSFPEKASLRKRLTFLSTEQSKELLNSVNYWRSEAKLTPLKKPSDKTFQVEIAHLAKLKAFQISKMMAQKGSEKNKRDWVLKTLKSEFFLTLSKKTFLGDECLDRILGLNERKVKTKLFGKNLKALYRNEDIYLDLDPEDLFTPYRVLAQISDQLKFKRGDSLIDLGSGLGRVGIVLGLLNPQLKFLGFELMTERHQQAQNASRRLGLSRRINFICGDLSRTLIPNASYYYLFNPFSYLTLRRVFQELYRNSEKKKIRVLMAQVGRPPRMVKRQPWLKQVYLSPLDKHWRAHGYSLYQSR
jgi:SAM-dependent methyltransferase